MKKAIMKPHYDQTLTDLQKQFIYGGLLGDLCIILPRGERRNAHLTMNHSSKQAEYVQFKYLMLKDFVRTPPRLTENRGWGKELIRFWTLSHPQFTEIYHLCYPNGRKTVSQEWLAKIHSPFALAVWYMDDGSLGKKANMRISTYGFSKEEQLILQDWLRKRWGISSKITQTKHHGFYLIFSAKDRGLFFNLIREHVIPSMQYKLLPPPKCLQCGRTFIPLNDHQKICSEKCRRQYRKKYLRHYYQKKKLSTT